MEDIKMAVNEVFEEKKPKIVEQRYRTNGAFSLLFVFCNTFHLQYACTLISGFQHYPELYVFMYFFLYLHM